MKVLFRAFVLWLPLMVAITGAFGFAYVAVQQNYRQSMNDPQIQMAEDAAASLADNYTPAAVIPRFDGHGVSVKTVDISTSLAPWIAVYDSAGTPLESSATLDGAPPHLPAELFDTSTWRYHKTWQAPTGPETRVTWQPNPDVRQAIVLVQFQTPHGAGYVAVGRSMRTVEGRIINLTELAAVAWSTTILATFVIIFTFLFIGWL